MPQPIKVSVVAGVVLSQQGKILLLQEKNPKVYGKWNLPAGRVDEGESIEQAAIREAQEEVGYLVELDQALPVVHEAAADSVLHAFAARITGGELHIAEDEILAAKWLTPAEIRAMAAELRSAAYIIGALDNMGL
jgi:ADP-ribose pyrophosphatase YjhB (NUDIX family)